MKAIAIWVREPACHSQRTLLLPDHAWPTSRVGAGHLLMVSLAWLTGGLEELGATCKYGDLWGTCQNPPHL